MRLPAKYRPRTLDEVVGQPMVVAALRQLVRQPFACCLLFESGPGVGKTSAALAFAREMGCVDEFSGLEIVPASELDIERCRHLFEVTLRLRPLEGSGWHVLILEELDGVSSKQVERYLKVRLETGLPSKCIVIATSNGAAKVDAALRQRFSYFCFVGGKFFAMACQERIAAVWSAETNGAPLPAGWMTWGWDGEEFSLRMALDKLGQSVLRWRDAA